MQDRKAERGCEHPNYNMRLEEMQVYKYLWRMIEVAESIAGFKEGGLPIGPGKIEDIDMRNWLQDGKRIRINGKTPSGKDFELSLEVTKCQESE